ncbi:virulence factor TspB C-terminal domain-related protein [Romboutsia ilealis]|uniref:virulence factor TspB C-terminal domain-related protein n=1 Tax=Romboutsia ilealis TaxID=1115758 RepID=UPI003AB953CF
MFTIHPLLSSISIKYNPLCSLFKYFNPFIIISTSLFLNILLAILILKFLSKSIFINGLHALNKIIITIIGIFIFMLILSSLLLTTTLNLISS